MKGFIFFVLVALLGAGCVSNQNVESEIRPNTVAADAEITSASYNEPADYRGNRVLRYPDFDVVFLSEEVAEQFGTTISYKKFEIRNRSGEKIGEFGWSSISGDTGSFTINAKEYRFSADVEEPGLDIYHP